MRLLQVRIAGDNETLYSDGLVDCYWCLKLERETGASAGHVPMYELEVFVSDVGVWEPMMRAIENRYVNPFTGFQLLAGVVTVQPARKRKCRQ